MRFSNGRAKALHYFRFVSTHHNQSYATNSIRRVDGVWFGPSAGRHGRISVVRRFVLSWPSDGTCPETGAESSLLVVCLCVFRSEVEWNIVPECSVIRPKPLAILSF